MADQPPPDREVCAVLLFPGPSASSLSTMRGTGPQFPEVHVG